MSPRPTSAPPAGAAPPEEPAAPSGDPVRALMAEHRELCEQAVDPLDIAAGLEDAGIGSGVAARYRHTDVFALAEELYARVERRPAPPAPSRTAEGWPRRAVRAFAVAVLHLPAVAVLAALPWLAGVTGPVGAVPALLVAAGWAAVAVRGGGAVARLAYGCGAALLLVPGAHGGPALAAVAAVSTGTAEFAARRLRQAGLEHLGAVGTAAEFRARMGPLLPLALAAQLVAAGAPAALLAPGAGGARAVAWATAVLLAALFLLAAVVRHADRSGAAAGAVAACGAVAGVLGAVVPAAGPAALLRLAAVAVTAAALAPFAWSVLGRPQAYRAPLRT